MSRGETKELKKNNNEGKGGINKDSSSNVEVTNTFDVLNNAEEERSQEKDLLNNVQVEDTSKEVQTNDIIQVDKEKVVNEEVQNKDVSLSKGEKVSIEVVSDGHDDIEEDQILKDEQIHDLTNDSGKESQVEGHINPVILEDKEEVIDSAIDVLGEEVEMTSNALVISNTGKQLGTVIMRSLPNKDDKWESIMQNVEKVYK
ncbi:hypothetical protein K7X08_035777 [Anisodus acutangulus]|uniref:Uncharacterized protein n=1 Tax=Anisodus acutangulus TaxID=402998 RepID=A0A9Q1MCQ2_9SOLA|nr:hypothetical protein K7X08_035777 [Anisodus acutangulus]